MRLVLAAAALSLPLAAFAAEGPRNGLRSEAISGTRICEGSPVRRTELGKPPAPKRLGELPAGNLVLSVQRDVGGCIEPVLVRQGIGAAPPAGSDAARP